MKLPVSLTNRSRCGRNRHASGKLFAYARHRGLTLVELMIAFALGSLVLAAVASLSLFGARSSAGIVNYSNMDAEGRAALDVISREIRESTALIAIQTNLTLKSLTFTNAQQGTSATLGWNATNRLVVLSRTGQMPLTALTGCDTFDFSLCQRTPWVTATNVTFYPATNTSGVLTLSLCKVVNLSWRCTRTLVAPQVNTESVKTAQIVLRNKQ